MGLLSPIALLLLLPLSGIVILLYLLKLKRKERVISSVLLWRQAVQDVQANAPFQKLRRNLLLFIQLAVLLLAVAALARPFARTVGLTGQNIVLIIDSSASMKARDVGGSRFEEAKRLALSTANRMGRGDQMLVITSSAKTRVVSAFTSDKKALAASISSLEPKDTRANLREAMVLALSLVAKKKNPQIVVLSDGGFAPVTDINPGSAKINFIRIGRRSDNVGLVALDARKTLSGEDQVFIGIRNFSDRHRTFNLEVYLDGRLFDIREQSLAPGASTQEILEGLPIQGGGVTAKLDIRDDLATDNIGHVYLTPPKHLSILLVTKGNLFLEKAFNLNPRTEVVKAVEPPADISRCDIAVFDCVRPPDRLPPGGYLLIDTDCKAAPAHPAGARTRPSVADWSRKHPATRYVDFSTINIGGAKTLSVEPWGQELVESEGGPVAAAGENAGRRFVMLGWDLLESDFPLRVGFPIFITNCIEWLGGRAEEAGAVTARTGDVVPFDAPGVREIGVTDPAGSQTALATGAGTAFFDGTERAGIYKVRIGNSVREFACNLLCADESDTRPRGRLEIGERRVAGSSAGVRTNREHWRLILLAALALLTFEWFVFHRRVV